MSRRLIEHCYGIPRGRVTSRGKVYLILHGNDSPIRAWKKAVICKSLTYRATGSACLR